MVFEQVAEAAVQKFNLFYPAFICVTGKWLEGWILGYRQVIHNAKMPTEAIVQVTATPTYDTERGTGIV